MRLLPLPNPTPSEEPTSVRIEVRNAVKAVATFSHPDMAWSFVERNEPILGPLTVHEVSTYEVRRRLFRPRKLQAVGKGS